ncbi:hypothetical protein WICMUC_001260 [Wickerhamomyces mucosus]|uniref:Uncharacterized protein n=1 Tax=Wickerhamomyces mucosus TaxID=1378264 RepID=A0A9P8PWX7_9ASCO|nr:hypothetical protein WICMUC_001260 [Wickerhamomyces mucosus]
MSNFLNSTPKAPKRLNDNSNNGSPKKWNIFKSSSSSSSSSNKSSNRSLLDSNVVSSTSSRVRSSPGKYRLNTGSLTVSNDHIKILDSSQKQLSDNDDLNQRSFSTSESLLFSPDMNNTIKAKTMSQATLNQIPYPRTTSLPRSTTSTDASLSTITLNSTTTPTLDAPPKIIPFYLNSSPNSRKKSYIHRKCCFCQELLSSTLGSEKVVELKCGDLCHEECLYVMLNDTLEVGDDHKIFPNCEVCGKTAIPTDEVLMNSITSRYLIQAPSYKSKQTVYPEEYANFQSLSLQSKNSKDLSITIPHHSLPKPYSDDYFATPELSQRYSQQHTAPPPPPSSSKQRMSQIAMPTRQSQHSAHQQTIPNHLTNNHRISQSSSRTSQYSNSQNYRSQSRGSSISAISSIVSSVPKTPSPTLSSFNNHNTDTNVSNLDQDSIKLSLLRSKFVEFLVKVLKPTEINEHKINSFGYLRLIDKLHISTKDDQTQFNEFIVFLFQFNLIIISPNFRKFKNIALPKKIIKIQTLNQSTIKIMIPNFNNDTIYVQNRQSNILSKWITALCDYEAVFDSNNISTTLVPEDLVCDNDTVINSNSGELREQELNVQDNDMKSPEAEMMTLPVSLSPIALASPSKLAGTPIIKSELFFKKTDNLIICINLKQAILPKDLVILKNILTVSKLKFESLKIIYCVHDNIISKGSFETIDFNDVPSSISSLPNFETELNRAINEFEPASDTHALLLVTNVSSLSSNNLDLANQLHLNINNPTRATQQQSSNSIHVISWDGIMEVIARKFELNFGYDSEDESSNSDSDFNSDYVDSDIDDHENKESESDNEEVNHDYHIRDDLTEFAADENQNLSFESSKSSLNFDKSDGRWSKLFEDIDNALMETTTESF